MAHSPYFYSAPEDTLPPSVLAEMAELESQEEDLNAFQKKRLFDLYQIEKKNLKDSSARAKWIDERLEKLKSDVEPLMIKGSVEPSIESEELSQGPKEKFKFSVPDLKRPFQQAHDAWNRDDNEEALSLIEKLMDSELYQKKAETPDRNRILNLYFRAALDSGNFEKCQKAYEKIKQESDCSKEAAQTGFLLALLNFSSGKIGEGKNIIVQQCDPDQSIANRTRRAYWLFRMSEENSSEQQKYYEELSAFPLPGYYMYLAERHKGRDLKLPNRTDFQFGNFTVSSKNDELIRSAEDRIRFGLRKDAVRLLQRVQRDLLTDPQKNQRALLYVSRLFQAAGNHLEAMKTINALLTGEGEEENRDAFSNDSELVSEFMNLYHKPFLNEVQWLGTAWGVDPDFIYSIMRQESAFNPGAVSVAGARGLMQLMPTLSKFLLEQWRAPVPKSRSYMFRGSENIKLATYHLNQLNQLAGHPALIAASYNAGVYRVSSWWRRAGHYPLDLFVELIPVNETRNYVKLVLRNFIYYKGLRNDGTVPKELIALQLPEAPAAIRSMSGSP